MVIFLSVNFQRFLVDCQDDRILLSLIKRVEKIRFLCLIHCIALLKAIINWLFYNELKTHSSKANLDTAQRSFCLHCYC